MVSRDPNDINHVRKIEIDTSYFKIGNKVTVKADTREELLSLDRIGIFSTTISAMSKGYEFYIWKITPKTIFLEKRKGNKEYLWVYPEMIKDVM